METEDDLTVVAEAGNGQEAVDLARRDAPDVVLMDVQMPGHRRIEGRPSGSPPPGRRPRC